MKTHFLSNLIWKLTDRPRYIPTYGEDFVWSKKSPLYNLYRIYELIFGRRMFSKDGVHWDSIRCESSGSLRYGKMTQTFFTKEAKAIHAEQMFYLKVKEVYNRIKNIRFEFEYVSVPVLVGFGKVEGKIPYKFAIATDNATGWGTKTSPTSPQTTSYTNNGNLIFFGLFMTDYTGGAVGGTLTCHYNSVAGTQISQGSDFSRLYGDSYLLSPATGSNTISVEFNQTISNDLAAVCSSYSGVKQSGQPDSSNNNSNISTTLTVSTTVVASNCWVVGYAYCSGANIVFSTGITDRYRTSTSGPSLDNDLGVGDSNGTVSTGSQSMTITPNSGSAGLGLKIASFAPLTNTVYTLTTAPASFSFTAQSVGDPVKRILPSSPASFSFTGMAVNIMKTIVYKLITLPAQYIFTGLPVSIIEYFGWSHQSPSSTPTWTNQSPSATPTWTNETQK